MPVLSGQILARDAAGHWQAAPGRLSHSDGVIADVTPAGAASDTLILPALSNAHDHGRGLRTVAFGAGDDALEVWIAALGREPATDPYLRAAVAFARMAEAGIATLNHCHNTADPERLVEEAEAVSRAARDVGVRVAFAVPISGRNPLTYGDPGPSSTACPRHRPTPSGRRPGADPPRRNNSPWSRRSPVSSTTSSTCNTAPSARNGWTTPCSPGSPRPPPAGRRVHMHLFETAYQKEWASAAYPAGLLTHLDAIGLLSERLTVAHGVHLDEADCALLAARGVHVSVNTSSNLRLRSGLPPVERFLRHGVRFGLGLDGMAFDDDEDALRELRVAWRLARGWGAEEVLSLDRLLDAALIDGRKAILGPHEPGGSLVAGAPADILTLDTARLTADVVEDETDLVALAVARARTEDVRSLVVNGRTVVENGKATGIDRPAAEAELMAQARAAGGLPPDGDLRTLQAALADYYRCGCHMHLPAPAPEKEPTP
jgi:cytosine/adenosine deaminase-related metal-dependent hydrolase